MDTHSVVEVTKRRLEVRGRETGRRKKGEGTQPFRERDMNRPDEPAELQVEAEVPEEATG